ncbi:MAG: E3 ubiquitin ligase family protein [Spirochaetales bacterium]|nr:E3 ubiquitin ligase family protein [Spirochaetales bacterium]
MGPFIGIGLVAGAIALFVAYSFQSKKLFQIKSTETSQINELKEISSAVATDIGGGSFNQITEVKGKAVCDNPLTSELAKAKCVYYSMSVTREYEETYWDTDANGNRIQQTRRGSDSVAHNTRSTPFYIQDATGNIKVNPDGASFVTEKAYSRFEPGEVRGTSLRIGGLTINLGSITQSSQRRTIGYRYEEEIIPLNRVLYVLGEAADASGELCMQKPAKKGSKFIISVKSEEELIRSAKGSMTVLLILSLIAGIGGITLFFLSLFNIIKF